MGHVRAVAARVVDPRLVRPHASQHLAARPARRGRASRYELAIRDGGPRPQAGAAGRRLLAEPTNEAHTGTTEPW